MTDTEVGAAFGALLRDYDGAWADTGYSHVAWLCMRTYARFVADDSTGKRDGIYGHFEDGFIRGYCQSHAEYAFQERGRGKVSCG